jgi:20S proteasome alpha/beta subunit
MTLIVGLKGADGVVLASDSQGTHGSMKHSTPKLFKTQTGLIWGSAGPLAATQSLYTELGRVTLRRDPEREAAKREIREAMRAAAADLSSDKGKAAISFEALFAWYDAQDHRHYLLHARHDGHAEFKPQYGAIGSSRQLAEFGFFGFSRSEFLDYRTLPLETAKMLAYTVAEDAVRSSAHGVDLPIQLAANSSGQASVLREDELQLVRHTVAVFQMHQVEFLVRKNHEQAEKVAGIVPDKDQSPTDDSRGLSPSEPLE